MNDPTRQNKKLLSMLDEGLSTSTSGTKHSRLTASLVRAIKSGLLKPGEKLPTELELAAATPFSLGTVQRAVRSLVEARLVKRSPKRGTFVAQPNKRVGDATWHFRFLDSDRKTLLPVYLTAISKTQIRQRGVWNAFLKGPILQLDRIANVNDEFRVYSKFFVASSECPRLRRIPVKSLNGKQFHAALDRDIAEPIMKIYHWVSFTSPTAHICRAIEVAPGTMCMSVEIAAVGRRGRYLYYQKLTVPPSGRHLALADPELEN